MGKTKKTQKKQAKKGSKLWSDFKYVSLRAYIPMGILLIVIFGGLMVFANMQSVGTLDVSVYREGIFKGVVRGTDNIGFTIEYTDGFFAGEEFSYMLKETPPNTTAFDNLEIGQYYSFGLNHDHVTGDYRKSILVHILDEDGTMIWEYNPLELRGRN